MQNIHLTFGQHHQTLHSSPGVDTLISNHFSTACSHKRYQFHTQMMHGRVRRFVTTVAVCPQTHKSLLKDKVNIHCAERCQRYLTTNHKPGTRPVIGYSRCPFYYHGLTFFPAWISNCIHYIVWDETTYPFRNFSGATVEISEWISNSIPHFTGYVISNHGGIKVNPC